MNAYGEIVNDEWHKTAKIRKNVVIDEFQIMPNHIHGIIRIIAVDSTINGTESFPITVVETPCSGVSTEMTLESKLTNITVSTMGTPTKSNRNRWKPGVLGAIIGQFKIKTTKRIRASGMIDFKWQPRFHDRIIRNDNELHRIRRYIRNNPENWGNDGEFTDYYCSPKFDGNGNIEIGEHRQYQK